MKGIRAYNFVADGPARCGRVAMICIFVFLTAFNIFSANPRKPVRPVRPAASVAPDTIPLSSPVFGDGEVVEDSFTVTPDSVEFTPVDTFAIVPGESMTAVRDSMISNGIAVPEEVKMRQFNPDPTRAVWLSALFPGLGQIYNRRFWKLPLVVAGYLGLVYGTSWNNNMLTDYTKAYADLLDSDPSTKSYMDFFPPTIKEESLNKQWLSNVLKSRKNFYRRNRDLCIIGMIGVYLVAMVDAYVDASLSHFDISPDLSMDLSPTLIPDGRASRPGFGLVWAFNF